MAIYSLAKHSDIQTRLRKEIRNNLPSISSSTSTSTSETISAQTLDSLPYLNAVTNEVIRYHPSVPATVRIATRPTTIANRPIPTNTSLMISPHILNLSPEFWGPDAEHFNPDRWLDAETGRANNTGGARSNYAMLTFLQGPRSCIGQGFARAELACLIAGLAGRFDITLRDLEKVVEVRLVAVEGW
ncbi:hypothetical protein SI65_08583 [Aspergillus cristatus]|uniref:Cytochrome P450 n=1 Tax=Aspergillus cristatus TaxID=573508 RepID=A0A1E3B5D6_ASPCR|nr:hypothetical protein SI65_08583 [Aspergillus cristatus]